ncbi:MAG TPA: dUTP diphosphatase [Bacteroidales bacterium]|jgi:dUTP pyrophosphatase|nr:dUTP diphosphatase [Bacteroidales bacterium]
MQVKFKKLVPEACAPCRAHATDAGCDLVATSCQTDSDGNIVYGTGIALEIPEGYMGLLFPRSSNAKKDLLLCNSVGVIDSAYRGEVMLKFKPTMGTKRYEVGDRIAQLIIMPYPDVEFCQTQTLSDTERGNGGYGSTGK